MSNSSPYELRAAIVHQLLTMSSQDRNNLEGDLRDIEGIVQGLDKIISGKSLLSAERKTSTNLGETDFGQFINEYNKTIEPEFVVERWMLGAITQLTERTDPGEIVEYQMPRQCGVSLFLRLLATYLQSRGKSVLLVLLKSDNMITNVNICQVGSHDFISVIQNNTYDYILLDNIREFNSKVYQSFLHAPERIKSRILSIDTVEK